MKYPAVVALLLSLLLALPLHAQTSLYEVSKGEHKLYLGGTIHLLRHRDYPLPAEFEQAYQQAQKLVLETDIQQANSAEFGARLAQAMMYTDGGSLAKSLSPELWAQLQAYAKQRQFPLAQVTMFKPLFVSLMLTVTEAQRLGMGDGVDMHFDRKARADNKALGQLESADQVVAYMKQMTEVDGDAVMRSTLRDLHNMEAMMDSMINHWRQGKLAALDQELAGNMRHEMPEVYQVLVVQRNQAWLPQITALLQTPERELVLVGALHLSGKQGLIAQLKRQGYRVKPYQLKP